MQNTIQQKKIFPSFGWWKLVVFVLAVGGLYYQVFLNKNLNSTWTEFQNSISSHALILTVLVFLLMILNWTLEVIRWKSVLNKVEDVKFLPALKATLCGVTFAMFAPNRVGEYAGRVLFLEDISRWRVFVVTTIVVFAQILCTIFFGTTGFIYTLFSSELFDGNVYVEWTVVVLLTITVVMLFILYFNISVIENLLEKFSFLNRIKIYLRVLLNYSYRELLRVFGLSAIRFSIFVLQYFLLLHIFNIELPVVSGVAMICSIFLVQTIIPSVAIVELGIRGNVALFFLTPFSENEIGIVSAAWALWLINLVIPAILGMILILTPRFKNSK